MKFTFIDTNFWLLPYLEKIDIFSELERILPEKFKIVTSQGVVNELKKIRESSKGKEGIAANIALELIEKKNVKIIKREGEVDEFIVKLAQYNKENLIVCTNDKGLRKKLKKLGVKVVGMREKNRLAFI